MQRNISQGNALSTDERAALKLKALADGHDASTLTDDELTQMYGEPQGEPQQSQGEPQGEPQQSQGEPQQSQGEPQLGDPGVEPPPAETPLEQQMQDIARAMDKWQNEHETLPALTQLHAQIEQAAQRAQRAATQAAMSAQDTVKPEVIHVHAAKGGEVKVLDNPHPAAEVVLRAIRAGVNIMLVGPAGSGKTTLCEQVAEALDLDFYFTGAVGMEFKLSGFKDGHGQFQDTQFYNAFKNGGLFLFDEYDVSSNQALLAFNAALANGYADFPVGQVKRHPDFVAIAAANTYGTGADREYVGRIQVDAAALDRFATLDLDYDESNEHNWARAALGLDSSAPKRRANPYGKCRDRDVTSDDVDGWVEYVQLIRKATRKARVRHVVSPRASITGAKLMAAGLPDDLIRDMVIWKGLDKASRDKIENAVQAA